MELEVQDQLSPENIGSISDFYQPWPKQRAFHEADAKHRLQIGGFGSAKSRALLMEAVAYCLECPGVNAIILRKTMPDLKRTVIDKFESDVPKRFYEFGSAKRGTFNKSDHIVYWPPRTVEELDPVTMTPVIDPLTRKPRLVKRQSKLYFAACETEKDIGKYLSTEFAFVGFEELGEFSYAIYDALEQRNRCTIPGVVPRMGAATNPMGIGWSWIKKLFIDKKPCYGMDAALYNPKDYFYVHSTVDDNPILSKDLAYVRGLEKSALRDRIRWGSLEVTTGQYFENWDVTRHYRPWSDFEFEPWQPVWVGWDYGFGHFAVMIFMTKAWLKPRWEGDSRRLVNVAIREIILQGATPEAQTQSLIASIPRLKDEDGDDAGYAEDIESIHFSWERFNKVSSNRTIADEVTEILQLAGLPPVTRSNTDRVAGWTKIYSMLDADEFFVIKPDGLHQGCPELAEALPLLVRGEGITTSLEDVIKPKGASLPDDLGDACRYAVAGVLLEQGEKPRDVLLREKLAGIKDPVAKFAAGYKEWIKTNRPNPWRGPNGPSVPSWVNKVQGR